MEWRDILRNITILPPSFAEMEKHIGKNSLLRPTKPFLLLPPRLNPHIRSYTPCLPP